ncbi:hypothetical protein SCUP515_11933 [Seiridium cupressi]
MATYSMESLNGTSRSFRLEQQIMAENSHIYYTAEALVSGFMFTFIFTFHTRLTLLTFAKKFRRRTNTPLLLHVAVGVFELVRLHYYRARYGALAHSPDLLDLVTCLIQVVTNLQLAKTSRRGDPYSTRACYQAGGILRLALEVAAFARGNAIVHAASVKCLHSFIYTRLVIFVATNMLRLDLRLPLSKLYAYGVFLGAVLAVNEGGLPMGVPVYIALIGAVMGLNRLTSDATLKSEDSYSRNTMKLLHFLRQWGFIELKTINRLESPPELDVRVKDEYINTQSPEISAIIEGPMEAVH